MGGQSATDPDRTSYGVYVGRGCMQRGSAVRAHIKCAPTTGNGRRYVCRGGLYIRPNKPSIPAASPPNVVGARIARPQPGTIYAALTVDVPGPGGMWACRPTPTAVGGLPCMRKLAGRCGHRPLRGKPSNPGANRNLVPGGHTGRPYDETGDESVGAGFMPARAAPLRRIHPRRPLPAPMPERAGSLV